jgi:hypothetical protein
MSRTYIRTILIVVLAAIVPTRLAATGATRVVLYAPYSSIEGDLRSGFTITSTVHGSCWIGSLASTRPDAWRCMAGNFIHDPCFSNPTKIQVACPPDPFAKAVLLIDLNKGLPSHGSSSGLSPWAMRLANGAKCIFVTGATGVVAGMRLNYECDPKGWVLGDLDRSSQPWRVFFTPEFHGADYVQVDVSEAVD